MVQSLFGATFCGVALAPGESWHPDVIKMSLHHPKRVTWGICILICTQRRASIQVALILQLKVVAKFLGRSTNFLELNHMELETPFHEFGHALHSLLSRTDYQHLSGTRVALDLAETPSNLFEYYAWDSRVLRTSARHYSTGEVIPWKLVESMEGAKKIFAAN